MNHVHPTPQVASTDRARLFFAIGLPEALKPRVTELRDRLREERSHLRASWVPIENLHFTLKFLGEMRQGLVPELVEAAREIRQEPFEVRLDRIGCFPSPRRPRALWLGGPTNPGAERLASRLDTLAARFGVASDPRPFRMHLTLARIRTGLPRGESPIESSVDGLAPFVCDGFTLYQSRLGKGTPTAGGGRSPRYERRAEIPLTA